MNIFTSMAEKIKTGIRTWLHIQPAVNGFISIQETLDYEGNAIKNKIWYRGESEELSQLYSQIDGNKTRFWSAYGDKKNTRGSPCYVMRYAGQYSNR